MRRSLVLVILVLGLAPSAFAQSGPRLDVSGGWQLLHGEGNTESLNGWFGDVAVNLNRVVALVGSVDRFYETLDVSDQLGNLIVNLRAESRMQAILGGARLNLRTFPRVVPFVEALGGPVFVSSTASTSIDGVVFEATEVSETHSLLQIGGGVTLGISEVLGVRVAVAQRRFFASGESGSATRVAAGVALSF
jgi:hypothetical protein